MIDSPTLGSYVAGTASLLAVAVALYAGAHQLRRWIVPGFSGAPAALAEAVLALSLLLPTLELLGSFGLLERGWIVAGCVAAGGGAALLGHHHAPADSRRRELPPVPVWGLLVAVAVASVLVAVWSTPTLMNAHEGMFSGDGTWYHLPFAAGFAQQHSTWALHFTDPMQLAAWFYPASSELLHSVGLVFFGTDWLSPFVNLGWLALGLLGGYCIGRPHGVGPATMVAAALVLGSGILLESQAGEPGNDMMGITLLIAVAALLINAQAAAENPAEPGGRARVFATGPLILAGLAAGLAISVKFTFLAPIGVITVGAIVLAGRGRRLPTAGLLLGAETLTGGYWYLRNILHAGNPLPELGGLGPLGLPHPDQMSIYPRDPHSVASYLFGHSKVITDSIGSQLHEAFGPLYAVILVLALVGALYAVFGSRDRVLAILGLAALATAVVYVFLPLSAAGPLGDPRGVFSNTRYLAPAVALGLVVIPVLPPLRRKPRVTAITLAVLTALCVVSVLAPAPWYSGHLGGAVLIVAVLVWIPVAAGALGGSAPIVRWVALGAAVAALTAAFGIGRQQEVDYAGAHYSTAILRQRARSDAISTFAWGQSVRDSRIALAGSGELYFAQYLFYGRDVSNRVQYIGQKGPDGSYRVPPDCAAFRREIDAGDYDYLVLSRWGDDADDRERYPIRDWVEDDPALSQISEERASPQNIWVYRVSGRLDPRGCT